MWKRYLSIIRFDSPSWLKFALKENSSMNHPFHSLQYIFIKCSSHFFFSLLESLCAGVTLTLSRVPKISRVVLELIRSSLSLSINSALVPEIWYYLSATNWTLSFDRSVGWTCRMHKSWKKTWVPTIMSIFLGVSTSGSAHSVILTIFIILCSRYTNSNIPVTFYITKNLSFTSNAFNLDLIAARVFTIGLSN